MSCFKFKSVKLWHFIISEKTYSIRKYHFRERQCKRMKKEKKRKYHFHRIVIIAPNIYCTFTLCQTQMWTPLIFMVTLWGRYYYQSCFQAETESQRGVTCPRFQMWDSTGTRIQTQAIRLRALTHHHCSTPPNGEQWICGRVKNT